MPIYQTSFEINASATRVWEVLTDFGSYPQWNPQIPRASANIVEGARIHLRLALPGSLRWTCQESSSKLDHASY
jgi:uncharacterized protein YndB with AHSA1/START domain